MALANARFFELANQEIESLTPLQRREPRVIETIQRMGTLKSEEHNIVEEVGRHASRLHRAVIKTIEALGPRQSSVQPSQLVGRWVSKNRRIE